MFALVPLAAAAGLSGCFHGEKTEPGGRAADGSSAATAFDRLRARPFRQPRIHMPAGRCVFPPALSPATEDVPHAGEAALGDGPVYVSFGSSAPHSVYTYVGDTVWTSAPDYSGPVLVRGRRIDAPGTVGFGSALKPSSELRLPAGSWDEDMELPRETWPRAVRNGWRVALENTRVDPDGCYAFQIDGESFSDVIVFGSTP